MTQFDERNISMMMDFYEMTMANGYFENGGKDIKVAFDVFYRRNPDGGGFAIFAGLEQIIEYVENMQFSKEDVEYFRAQNLFDENFLNYLEDFHFHGDIYAFPEGTIMYPNEPIITVIADLIDAQLIETAILAQVNHQSLIATKARRIVRAAEGRFVSDFGARRAHNIDAATYGARAAFLTFQSTARWLTVGLCILMTSSRRSKNMPKFIRSPRLCLLILTTLFTAEYPMQFVLQKKFWSRKEIV